MSVQIKQNTVLNIEIVQTNSATIILPSGAELAKGGNSVRFIRKNGTLIAEYLATDVTTLTDKDGNVTNVAGDNDLLFNTLRDTFFFSVAGGVAQTLQETTNAGNTTTDDIIQIGGKMVAPEFEVSGASLDLSQRVKIFAFGSSYSQLDNVVEEKSLILKIPFTTSGTSDVIKPILGARQNIVAQSDDTSVFSGSLLVTDDVTATADFVTEIITYRFQDAGKPVKLRIVGDNGTSTFDLFGTSEDPFIRFITVSGDNVLLLSSPVPSTTGVTFDTTLETEDGSPLNILGDEPGEAYVFALGSVGASSFAPYLEVDSYPYSEEVFDVSFLGSYNANSRNLMISGSNPAPAFSRNDQPVLNFDDDVTYEVAISDAISSDYLGGDIIFNIDWIAKTATTGDVTWGVSVERGNGNIDSDSFATEQTGTDTTNVVNGVPTRTNITLTQAQADGVLAGESWRFKIRRGTLSGDTMTGIAQIKNITLTQ